MLKLFLQRALPMILLAAGLYACNCSGKKTDCPGFSSVQMEKWFPYSNGQKLVFATAAGNRDTFALERTEETTPYTYTSSWSLPAGQCSAVRSFETLQKDSIGRPVFNHSMNVSSKGNGQPTDSSARFSIRGQYVQLRAFNDTSFVYIYDVSNLMQQTFMPSVTIDAKTFQNVIRATRDTTNVKTPGLSQVFIARNAGLVAYREYPSGRFWVRQ
jgi:hypothetical protein